MEWNDMDDCEAITRRVPPEGRFKWTQIDTDEEFLCGSFWLDGKDRSDRSNLSYFFFSKTTANSFSQGWGFT